MRSRSGLSLVAAAGLLSFVAALGGAWLALALDEPNVVITERVVEVQPFENTWEPSDRDLEALGVLFAELGGSEQALELGLEYEIVGLVCGENQSAAEILAFMPEIAMPLDQLETFADEVRAVCP